MRPPTPEDFKTEDGIDWVAYYDAQEDYRIHCESNWDYINE